MTKLIHFVTSNLNDTSSDADEFSDDKPAVRLPVKLNMRVAESGLLIEKWINGYWPL